MGVGGILCILMPAAGFASLFSAALTAMHAGLLHQQIPAGTPQSQTSTPPYQVTGAQTAPGNASNPAIGLVVDTRAVFKDRTKQDERTDLKEAEFSFAAAVDPFLSAEAFISVAKEEGETKVDVEEAYGAYTNLGKGLSGRFGELKAAVGRVNRQHTHSLAYMDLPLVVQDTFGPEGLKGAGGELSYLFPTDRYLDLTVEALGPEDGPVFMGTRTSNPVALAHLRTFFDFSEDLSGQLGFTAINGPTSDSRGNVLGLDYTMKYQPGVPNRFWQFETEAYWADKASQSADRTMGCFAAFTTQLRSNLFASARLDYSEVPNTTEIHRGYMVNLTLKPTEFHHWRIEFEHFDNRLEKDFDRLSLQFVWLIGAHPVHKY